MGIRYPNVVLGFKKDRAFRWIISTFPVTVVKVKNTQKLEGDLFKAIVKSIHEERKFFGDGLFRKCQRQSFCPLPSEVTVRCRGQPGAGACWVTALDFIYFK